MREALTEKPALGGDGLTGHNRVLHCAKIMKPPKVQGRLIRFLSPVPLLVTFAVAGAMLVPAGAQTTNMSELRELRIACLESFNTAKARLDELHEFVGQQAERERTASDQLFDLQQSAASAKRRNLDLQQEVRRCTSRLERAQGAIERATTSYRAAVESMPSGEDWAKNGSAALAELRRAADAAPQDVWKHKRFKEIQVEFVDTLQQWRAARRWMEQASFDLEMRAAPGVFQRITRQIESASKELKALERQLADREVALGKLSRQSEQWGAAIRTLREEEAKTRDHLAAIGFKFHLVDLQFAAWRMNLSDLRDEDVGLLSDALEQAIESEAMKKPGYLTPLPGSSSHASVGMPGVAEPEGSGEEREQVEKDDGAFRDLLARVLLAQARLRFLSTVLTGEFHSVQGAIRSLEAIEQEAGELAEETARLAADQESLRRSQETEQQTLTKGTDTLDLVKKRFAADHKVISQLLDDAAERTATLARSLER
ncbi:MAG TPA: hypothetical protein VN673_14640 [Clostridia bacterium]|nr:hypothetical protein [Clostridia bacterium]